MTKDEPLWIDGCLKCKIFKNKMVYGELLYPESNDKIKDSEYVVYKNDREDIIVVFRDHVNSVTRESWGRMLYIVKKLLGPKIKVKYDIKVADEHFMCTVAEV